MLSRFLPSTRMIVHPLNLNPTKWVERLQSDLATIRYHGWTDYHYNEWHRSLGYQWLLAHHDRNLSLRRRFAEHQMILTLRLDRKLLWY